MRLRTLLSFLVVAAACGDNIIPGDQPDAVRPDGPGADAAVDADPTMPGAITLVVTSPAGETGTINVVASRTGGSLGVVSVDYATSDDTATATADYTAATGTLTWADGDLADKMFTIPLVDDLTIEGDETLGIDLTNPTGNVTVNPPPTAVINDDDRVGDAFIVTSTGRLLSFDRAMPGTFTNAVTVAGLPAGQAVLDLDARPATGAVYALLANGTLYTIDPTTGAATLASTLVLDPADLSAPFTGLSGASFAIDFNPVPDRLRIVSNTGQNLRVNVDTGATVTDTNLTAGVAATGAAYTNSVAVACRTSLFVIDAATDRLLAQNPPNDGVTTAIGAGLGVDATAVRGFDTSATAGGVSTAYAILVVGGAQRLYTIDVITGAATLVGTFALDPGETIRGLQLPTLPASTPVTQAPGELVAISETNILSFERGAPAKTCTNTAIVGLTAGDVPTGIDARPSTGLLYILTNNAGAGKLYTVDVATGAATAGTALSVPLAGSQFGMDFNPTGPVALRIVSTTGQNLRVTNIATGETVADTTLAGGATRATAAAYTDSLPGAGTTTLYVIDPMTDTLLLQNPPNSGTLTTVGPLGANLTDLAAFDIDGRDNTGFVAANSGGGGGGGGGNTMTTFHTIDLTTGAVSATLGLIGGGTQRIIGLTRTTPTTTVYGVTAANQLVRLSLSDPTNIGTPLAITGLAAGENVVGLDLRPSTGVLYAVGSTGRAYRIDPTTGAATLASTFAADAGDLTGAFTALAGTQFGVDFNPTGPVALRIVSDSEQNLRVGDVNVGNTFTDTDLARSLRVYSAVAAAYSNNVTPAPTTTVLYALDDINDRLIAIAPPNNGSIREIGPLGIDATASAAMEITGPGSAIAVLNAAVGKQYVTIDLATGAATAVGTLPVAGTVIGIAAASSVAAPAESAAVFGLTSTGSLFSFPRNAPSTITTIGGITGVPLTESVEAFDLRPSTGELYILTRSLLGVGRLYTVSATTAVATEVVVLTADPVDSTAPYAGLSLVVRYTIDFNPVGAVPLRILGSDNSNLRVPTPAAGGGLVTTDAALAVGAPDVGAAAYTNSFRTAAGAPTTTSLFVIDATTGSLLQQTPPNDGMLVSIGALSPSLTFAGASTFDIAGGNNGLALATLTVGAEPSSRLYRVNLQRGTATEIGTLPITGMPITGMTIQVR